MVYNQPKGSKTSPGKVLIKIRLSELTDLALDEEVSLSVRPSVRLSMSVRLFARPPTQLEEPKLRTLWLNKISRVEKIEQNGKIVTKLWTPSKSSKLCSCHFEEPPQAKSRKKWFQIPSIFSHRPASSKPSRKAPKERQVSNQNVKRALYTAVPIGAVIDDAGIVDRDSCADVEVPDTADIITEAVQLAGHDYLITEEDKESFKLLESNKDLAGVIQERERLQTCEYDLKKLKASGQVLEVNELRNNDKLFRYCTGLKNEVFDSLYKYLEP
ncbi:hypothetical protein MAR_019468 [Mya arenaria]|uniref:THAP-type domain-containing protein n=1 Tax=Mya arenaria TaxID=6604 RepID=A0ABY7E6P1_MYAAR|nr:hypothetical protein MAR_019468 [Mya arenaria]